MNIKLLAALSMSFLPALGLPLSSAFAQGTAFSYQGRLNDGDALANGIYDFQFTLYDNGTAGSLVAGPIDRAPVTISNGLFSVTLDFGGGAVFNGDPRWLEISVRNSAGGALTKLAPRQQITANPYAITAGNLSGTLPTAQLSGALSPATLPSGGNWPLTSTLTIDSGTLSIDPGAHRVGVGTATPAAPLTVYSTNWFYGVEHTDGTRRLSTYLDENGAWFGSVSPHRLFFYVNNGTPSMTLDLDGQVGIGTMSPVDSLHVVQGLASVRLDSISDPNGSVLELRNTMASPNYLGAINFNNSSATYPGQIGYLSNNDMIFRTANAERMRLDSSGALRVQGSVRLDAADAPMIVRQWDPFTSGSKTGVGRWGLFMEPNTLFVGIPGSDYPPLGSIGFGGWLANGTRQNWMTIAKGGNVGIGTNAPTDKLHVAGDLRLEGRLKLSPRERWLSIPANRFVPQYPVSEIDGSDWGYDYPLIKYRMEPGDVHKFSGYFHVEGSFPLDLPHGAKILQVLISCTDRSADRNLQFKFQRVNALSGLTTDLVTAQSSGSFGLQSVTMTSSLPQSVDNSVHCYAITANTVGPGFVAANEFELQPIRIKYELTEVP